MSGWIAGSIGVGRFAGRELVLQCKLVLFLQVSLKHIHSLVSCFVSFHFPPSRSHVSILKIILGDETNERTLYSPRASWILGNYFHLYLSLSPAFAGDKVRGADHHEDRSGMREASCETLSSRHGTYDTVTAKHNLHPYCAGLVWQMKLLVITST